MSAPGRTWVSSNDVLDTLEALYYAPKFCQDKELAAKMEMAEVRVRNAMSELAFEYKIARDLLNAHYDQRDEIRERLRNA